MLKLSILTILLSIPCGLSGAEIKYPDYASLGHRVYISALRAGNHDESGENSYYFVLTAQATKDKSLTPKKADKKKSQAKDNSIDQEPVQFGELEIKSLDKWKSTEPIEDQLFTDITGDSLRELTSVAMRTLEATEDQIMISIKIDMYEKNKVFFFFGEDQHIGTTTYHPVPLLKKFKKTETRPSTKIIDNKGTDVTFSLRFDDKPVDASSKKEEESK